MQLTHSQFERLRELASMAGAPQLTDVNGCLDAIQEMLVTQDNHVELKQSKRPRITHRVNNAASKSTVALSTGGAGRAGLAATSSPPKPAGEVETDEEQRARRARAAARYIGWDIVVPSYEGLFLDAAEDDYLDSFGVVKKQDCRVNSDAITKVPLLTRYPRKLLENCIRGVEWTALTPLESRAALRQLCTLPIGGSTRTCTFVLACSRADAGAGTGASFALCMALTAPCLSVTHMHVFAHDCDHRHVHVGVGGRECTLHV
jgi:hypothetical protein